MAPGLFVTAQQVGQAIGLAALADVASAVTNSHDGSLVSGYQAAFLVSIGISVLAILIVAIQMRNVWQRRGIDDSSHWRPPSSSVPCCGRHRLQSMRRLQSPAIEQPAHVSVVLLSAPSCPHSFAFAAHVRRRLSTVRILRAI